MKLYAGLRQLTSPYSNLPLPTQDDIGKTLKVDENLEYILSESSGIGFKKWNASVEYEVSDYCIYNKKLYECIETHTSIETFEDSKWELALDTGTTKNGIDVYAITQVEYDELLANNSLDDKALYIITDSMGNGDDGGGDNETPIKIEFETEDIDFSNF